MVCHCIHSIQDTYSSVEGSTIPPNQWAQALVIELLEATHGQWLYQYLQIHDKVYSTCITTRKEELQQEIEKQQEMGTEDLLDMDQCLAKINLEDLESSSGKRQEYWLVDICTAREASILWRQQQLNTCRRESTGRGICINISNPVQSG